MGASHDDLTRHAALLAGLARGLMGPGADADDLQQEVWLAALQGGAAVSRPHGWLATVARRLAARERLSEARRRERERHVARAEQQPAPQELVAELEIAQRLTAAVRRLAEPLRSTLHQHYAEGLTAAEIAERTRVPVETVRSRIQRGLELLRRDLARELGDDARAWRAAFAPLLALTTARRGGLMATTWKLVGAGALALAALTIAWKNVETERAAPRGLERTEAWSAELARASRSDGELRPPPAAPERAARRRPWAPRARARRARRGAGARPARVNDGRRAADAAARRRAARVRRPAAAGAVGHARRSGDARGGRADGARAAEDLRGPVQAARPLAAGSHRPDAARRRGARAARRRRAGRGARRARDGPRRAVRRHVRAVALRAARHAAPDR
ncbi:MAG: sigma-70 family RNA polymerase sigma factor [Planctomycetes bacterium]|nr:sigma-70 family RNA polymerase sigma factor [Planctomycetota bacterium]